MTPIMTARHALGLAFLVLTPSSANAEESPFVNGLTEMLQIGRRTISSWDTQAHILVCLAVTIGTLGVVTGLLQGSHRPWAKTATVAVGAIVSISTVVNSTVFPADFRTFKQSAASGRIELHHMERLLSDLRTTLSIDNQRAYRDEFLTHYDAITKLEMSLLGIARSKTTSRIDPLPGVSVAMAEDRPPAQTPSWVREKPRDTSTSRFFVGVAASPQLDSAREASLRNAEDQAVRELVLKIAKGTTSADVLQDFRTLVKKLADVNETTFVFDKESAKFKYWTLLRLNPHAFDARVVGGGTPVKKLPGARVLHSIESQYFSQDRTLRVEYANVLIEAGRARFSFQAAATIRARFPESTSPSVNLLFVDRNRKPLGLFRNVARASVDTCGGYQSHAADLRDEDFPRPVLDRAEAFLLQVQVATMPARCDRGMPPPF